MRAIRRSDRQRSFQGLKLCWLLKKRVSVKKSRATQFWPRWEFITQSIRAPPKDYDYDEHSNLIQTASLSILLDTWKTISDAIMKIQGIILISWAVGRGRQSCSLSKPLTREREATLLGTEKRKSYGGHES